MGFEILAFDFDRIFLPNTEIYLNFRTRCKKYIKKDIIIIFNFMLKLLRCMHLFNFKY